MESNKIKIFNGSIFDFNRKIGGNTHCFVVGLEVLDNMPHDRLYFDKKSGELTSMSSIKITRDSEGKEISLNETQLSIEDEMCKLFVDLYKS